jgi:hypothetical protein
MSAPHAGPHTAHDRGDVADVGVEDLQRHPVPVAERDRPRLALVVADDRELAAHAGGLAGGDQPALRAGDLECDVGVEPGEALLPHVDRARRAQRAGALEGVRARVGAASSTALTAQASGSASAGSRGTEPPRSSTRRGPPRSRRSRARSPTPRPGRRARSG